MKPKTVRNIAGLVSSAFVRAIKWGLATTNPVTHSDLPKVRKRIGMALLPSEQDRLTQCATGPWCLPVFLDVAAATGARRGEVLALRWPDVKGMVVLIDRSLCQTRDGLVFKSTKTEEPRKVELPPSMVACLDAHRLRQDEFRRQFGPDYHSDLDLIFANPDGSPLMPNSISSTVSRLCRRLDLPKGASLHVLRHSHASLLLANGVDLATVSARLGHSSVRTTADIYSHAVRGQRPRRRTVLGRHHAAITRRDREIQNCKLAVACPHYNKKRLVNGRLLLLEERLPTDGLAISGDFRRPGRTSTDAQELRSGETYWTPTKFRHKELPRASVGRLSTPRMRIWTGSQFASAGDEEDLEKGANLLESALACEDLVNKTRVRQPRFYNSGVIRLHVGNFVIDHVIVG